MYWLWEGSSPGFARCPAVAPFPHPYGIRWHQVWSVPATRTALVSNGGTHLRQPSAAALGSAVTALQPTSIMDMAASQSYLPGGNGHYRTPPILLHSCLHVLHMHAILPPILHPHPCLPSLYHRICSNSHHPHPPSPISTPGTLPLGARPAGSSELATHTGASPSNPLLANLSVHHCIIGIH